MKLFFLTIMALSFKFSLIAQATGTVFEDLNKNGKQDKQEIGLSNIAVTNGVEVVLTNSKGQYNLTVGDDNIISVITPSGYEVPLNEENLPQFYYIHKPNGSPNLQFKGVKPTGKLPKTINFPLYKIEDSKSFSALVFGDPQPYNLEEIDQFKRGIVNEVLSVKNMAFGLSLGDLVGNDLDLFNPYIKATKQVGIPWYNVMGNHDINFDANQDVLSDETYEAHFGPNNYAFNRGKVHFIILDNIIYPDPRDSKGYWGGFRKDQLDFVENDLKFVPKDHLIVLAFHIPLKEEDNRDLFIDESRERLFKILEDFPNTLSLSAHTHMQRQTFFGKEDGLNRDTLHHEYNVGTTSGDWYKGKLNEEGIPISTMRDGTPKGYAFIHFTGNKYVVQYKVAGKSKDYQMNISIPKVVEKDKKTSASIYVNFFLGESKDKILFRIDGGKWINMNYVEEYDPLYMQSIYEWDLTDTLFEGKRSSDPIVSKHLWKAGIPVDLNKGKHEVEIKATDMFGNEHFGKESYIIK